MKCHITTNILTFKSYYSFWVDQGAWCCEKAEFLLWFHFPKHLPLHPFYLPAGHLLSLSSDIHLSLFHLPPNLLTWQKISFSLASTSRLASWTGSSKGLLSSTAHCFKAGTVGGRWFWMTGQQPMRQDLASLVIGISAAVTLSLCYTSRNAQRFCTSNECLCGS